MPKRFDILLNLRNRRLFFRDRADFDFGVVVLPHERESDFADLAVFETDARHHPDPAFEKALVALDEAKAAEAVIDRLGLVDLNAERIVFRVRHHDVGARVDRGVRYLALEIEYLAAMAHVMGRHDDIGLRFQRSHVLAETLEVVTVAPGQNFRRRAGTVRRQRAVLVIDGLIRGVRLDDSNARMLLARFVIVGPVLRSALQESEARAAAGDDRGRARRGAVDAGADMRDAELIETGVR